MQEFVVNGIIHNEFVGFGNGFVFGAVFVGEVEYGLIFDKGGQHFGNLFFGNGHIRFHTAFVIDSPSVFGFICNSQRVRDFVASFSGVAVEILNVLHAAAAGDVVFRNGDFHAGVVVHGIDFLHQTFAEGFLSHDDGAVEILEGSGNDFRGGGTVFVH